MYYIYALIFLVPSAIVAIILIRKRKQKRMKAGDSTLPYMDFDIIEIFVSNPKVGAKRLYPRVNKTKFYKGGFMSSMIGVAHNRQIQQMKKVPWTLNTVIEMADDELSFMKEIAQSTSSTTYIMTHIDGSYYSGEATIISTVKGFTHEPTFPLNLIGCGVIKKI